MLITANLPPPQAYAAPMPVHVLDTRPLRWAGGAMLVGGTVLPLLPGSPGLTCPLRILTGIPCPLCGMTTSVTATMQLQLDDALVASPAGVLLVVLATVLLLARPDRLRLPPPWTAVTALSLMWAWQLHRFSIL